MENCKEIDHKSNAGKIVPGGALCVECGGFMADTDAQKMDKINKAIADLSADPDTVKLVEGIEARIATTKGHYGDYMSALTHFAKDKVSLYIMSRAMVKAGADTYGVTWAVKLLIGN